MYLKINALLLLTSAWPFLHAADAPGVILAGYNPAWREQRRFGLMTLRNFGLGKQSMEERILGEIERILKILEQSIGTSITDPLKSVLKTQNPKANIFIKSFFFFHLISPGKPMSPQLMFHNAASNIICQVLFAKRFDYDDEFMKFFVSLFHETSKIINGRWGLVSHKFDHTAAHAHYKLLSGEPSSLRVTHTMLWTLKGILKRKTYLAFFSPIQIYDSIPMVRNLPLPFQKAFKMFKVRHSFHSLEIEAYLFDW